MNDQGGAAGADLLRRLTRARGGHLRGPLDQSAIRLVHSRSGRLRQSDEGSEEGQRQERREDPPATQLGLWTHCGPRKARSLSPTFSMGCARARARLALSLG